MNELVVSIKLGCIVKHTDFQRRLSAQDKLSELIKILLKNGDTVISSTLAAELQVSARTIRNYVHEINGLGDNDVIKANNNGYYISNKLAATELLRIQQQVGTHIPQNSSERFTYIVQKLLRNNSLDSFSLANELYISYGTLKRTILYSNKKLERWKIKISSAHDQLSLLGNESSKRQLFSYLIYRENTGNLLNSNYLKESFGQEATSKIQTMINQIIDHYNLRLNEFSYNNLLLHLLILVSRLAIGKTINQPVTTSDSKVGPYTKDLAKLIEKNFSANITSSEIQEIDILFKSNANLYSELVDQKYFAPTFREKVQTIINKVESMYLVNLHSQTFIRPFSIHLYNLIYRLKHHSVLHNPIKIDISNNFPLIYDIATYVAFQINELWHFKIAEDEIAFIALHIGAEIERQKQAPEKLKAAIVIPTYLNIGEQVFDFFRRNFSKDISIVKQSDQIFDNDNLSTYDLVFLIMISNEKNQLNSRYIQLDPFQLNEQKGKIQAAIEQATLHRKKELFKENATNFFTNDLFWNLNQNTTKKKLTKDICNKMKSLGIIAPNFYQEILQREAMGSTAFKQIAIVHPMDYNAKQTKVAVALSQTGIKWDNKVVNIIFIISISKEYKDEFRNIYENLMAFLSDKQTFKKVLSAQTIEEFYMNLLS